MNTDELRPREFTIWVARERQRRLRAITRGELPPMPKRTIHGGIVLDDDACPVRRK